MVGKREKILERTSMGMPDNDLADAAIAKDNAAIPNAETAAVDGASPNPKLQEVDVPAGEAVDVNKPIDLSALPTWKDQLTFRALFLGACLGGVFCIM